MKAKAIISRIIKITLYAVFGIVLLATGVLTLLYSPWAQDNIRQALVRSFRSADGSSELVLESLELRFPLSLSLGGLAMTENGDTVIAAQKADIDVKLLPLLKGEVKIDKARLENARFRSGVPDSATYMDINANDILLQPASVRLADMDISLDNGYISGGRFELILNPDTTTTEPSDPTKMKIRLGELRLDDFTYSMRMMPTIDTLSAEIKSSVLSGGEIDLLAQTIKLHRFEGRGLDARYIAPDSASIAAGAPYPTSGDSTVSAPWTITIDSIGFTGSKALYTTAGTKPQDGLDFGYIAVDSLSLGLKGFYNQASVVRLPISISGKERSGVALDAAGKLDISETALTFSDFTLSTANGSHIGFDGLMGSGDMTTDPTLPLELKLNGGMAPEDLALMFPAFGLYWNSLPHDEPVGIKTDINGTAGRLDIGKLDIAITRFASLNIAGILTNMMNPETIGADIDIDGRIGNIGKLKRALLPDTRALNIPPMTIKGKVAANTGNIRGNLSAFTGKGAIRLNALWKSRAEDYSLTLRTSSFPVDAFMPEAGIGRVSADISAEGHGYDPTSVKTRLDASAAISSAEYSGHTYSGINAKATVIDGNAEISLSSVDPNAELELTASGNLIGDVYKWKVKADGTNLDLYALRLSETPATIEVYLDGNAEIGPDKNDIAGEITLHDLFFRQESGTTALSDIIMKLNAADSLTVVDIVNRDMTLKFSSPSALTGIADRFADASSALSSQLSAYSINIDTLQQLLPPFRLDIAAGQSNMLNDILSPSDMSFRKLSLLATNDSILSLGSSVLSFKTGETRLDTITFNLGQHKEHLHFSSHIGNRPGTFDAWKDVDITGRLDNNNASLQLHQNNRKGATGFEIGLNAAIADSVLTVRLVPYDQIIGYKPWRINEDNFISYNLVSEHIDANLNMSGDGSSIALYTEHTPGGTDHAQEDLIIKLSDIHIADWVSLNPFAPPMKGDLNADMRLNRHDGQLLGKGMIALDRFYYDRQPVASLKADFDIATMAGGMFKANADLYVNGQKTITVGGIMNDSIAESPLNLDFSMIRFPLATVNPFLGASTGRLRGMLNGTLKISGKSQKPVYDGYLDFDSTAFMLAMTGTEYTFSEVRIPVEKSIVSLNNFEITGCNKNPLSINGNVDLSDMSDARFNLRLKAADMQIVNSRRAAKGADIYGKAFISLDATAHGSMSLMWLDASLSLDAGTNVTYVIPDATSVIESQSTGEMVKFVNFTDTAAVMAADSIAPSGMSMFINALLTVREGSIINVDLSSNGNDKVQLQSNGTLNYTATPVGEGRLSGRLAIDKGFIRYTPPFMSEKMFNFQEGSYVAFNGNMMNPTINVRAIDDVKANVTQEGQNSRLIDFDVILAVTGTMNNLNVSFDLSTNDDITVANELQAMSADQRANQAMNLLLYNVYTGPGSKGNASLSGNPLFSFLESQINTWAANNIRAVDISFGINQYDRTIDGSTAQTTSYSYQVSKSLFNDRFKIIVGGNYSTDANADENFSQNLINDISFEYYLNNSRSMYVRLFRHTGYESILEGEITQTGVGFVYRRKLLRLSDMFRFRKPKNTNVEPQTESEK